MQTKFRYTLVRDMCMQRTGALGVDEFLRDSVASGRDCCPENKREPTVRKGGTKARQEEEIQET